MGAELSGWLFDVYPDPGRGAVVWLVGQDGVRYRFTQDLPITFYVGGEAQELNRLWSQLKRSSLSFELTKRRHLFHGDLEVVAIRVASGARQRSVFRSLHRAFPELEYFDADLALAVHYFSATHTFPLALCTVSVDEHDRVTAITTRDDRWSLKPKFPDLRVLQLEPGGDPNKALPPSIRATLGNHTETFSTKDPRGLLQSVSRIIELGDPDIIRTRFGDKWLFPYLFSIARSGGLPFNPNRDKSQAPIQVKPSQFESYGRLVHRDQQTLLLGRAHIDPQNSMAFKDWGSLGIFETARLSNLPLQNAARRSAGGAFVGMQIAASLENGILIPIRKQQRERFKRATQLIAADNGGLIFKPIVGLHPEVAEIDFFSMYPNIMTGWNISAETVGEQGGQTRWAPGIGVPIRQDNPGIVAMILKPVMEKRKAAKEILEGGEASGYDRTYLQVAYEFLKGLGWVSYGYQGFSGNRIGSIEAHEAINAVSRDAIAQAKEAAEEMGFEVLHVYVDSLFVRVGQNEAKLEELREDIRRRTGLKADLEGIMRWVVFLPSKQNPNVPVPNCFYGVFRNGEMKCRGIMARRGDTPHYIAEVQLDAIKILARETEFEKLPGLIPKVVFFFRSCHQDLTQGRVPLEHLLVSQTLSRDLEDFKVLSPAGRAARQLAADGKAIGAGQNVDFLRVKQAPFALSWHAVDEAQGVELDIDWYCEQLLRAADEVLQPLGVGKETLEAWLAGQGSYWAPEDFVHKSPVELPLLEEINQKGSQRKQLHFFR